MHFERITPISPRCATYEQKRWQLSTTPTHVTKLQELETYISICHLNTQSMTSTFDEFQFMVNESKFDIITLSETWLKNDKHLLEYVNLPGYKFCYRNRDEKRGVGVGLYIKDYITCKGKKLIDHICSNICKKRILHSDVLPCPTISDHDAP